MDNFYKSLGKFCVRFKWFIVAFWLIGTVLCVSNFPNLSNEVKSNNSQFLPPSAPSNHANQLGAPFFNVNYTNVQIVLVNRDNSKISPSEIQFTRNIIGDLKKVPTVVSVNEVGLSGDGEAFQLQIESNVNRTSSGPANTLITNIENVLSNSVKNGNLRAYIAGPVADQFSNKNTSSKVQQELQMFSILVVLIILFLVFRSLLAPFVTLLPAVLCAILSSSIVAEIALHGLQVSQISDFMLYILLIGAGTDYGLFLVFRVREEIRKGLDTKEAIIKGLTRVGESITFSAATVIAALLSLTLSSFGIYNSLGVPLAIALFVMLLAALTLLPALLAIFGRVLFWPAKLNVGTSSEGLWGSLAGKVLNKPKVTLSVGIGAFVIFALFSFGNKPAGFGASNPPTPGSNAYYGDKYLSEHFPSGASNNTGAIFVLNSPIWVQPQIAQKAYIGLVDSGYFKSLVGPFNASGVAISPEQYVYLHSLLGSPYELPTVYPGTSSVSRPLYYAYRLSYRFVSKDGKTIFFSGPLTVGDSGSNAAINEVPKLRDAVAKVALSIHALDNGVIGEAPAVYDINNYSDKDIFKVLPVAVLVIAILLVLVLRSLVAPVYMILSVVLSYFTALGLSVVLFIYLVGDGGLSFILPFLMFLFLLALGEDYNILVMTRIREEAHDLPLRAAVKKAIGITGTTVTSAGLVLASSFFVFGVVGAGSGGSSTIRDVGFGLGMGIILDAFVVRSFFIPALVVLLGRWNWWPSKLSRVEHPEPEAFPDIETPISV